MAERINSIMSSLLAAVAIAVCLSAPPAQAQAIDPLPPSDKTSYTVEEQQQIATYVIKRVTVIGEGDAQARKKAKGELLMPLRRAGVSVAFRRLVREAGIDLLAAIADGKDEDAAITALFVLAEIADDASRLVVQGHTDDEALAMRYAAIVAMKRTFRVVNTFSPAIDPGRVTQMVTHLTDRLEHERDARAAEAITLALLRASEIQRTGFETAATRALTGLSDKSGVRLRAAAGSDRSIVLISNFRVAEELAGRLAAAGRVPAEISRAGAAFSGEVLGHLAHVANEGEMPESREVEIALVTLCERNIVFASMKLNGVMTAPGLPTMLRDGDYKAFYEATTRFALSLSGPPCSLPAEDMPRIRDALEGK